MNRLVAARAAADSCCRRESIDPCHCSEAEVNFGIISQGAQGAFLQQ